MEWRERLQQHLDWHYSHLGLNVADLTPTESPGYWRITAPCGGLRGGCRNELHRTLFNDGPTHHTISYHDPVRATGGRWASPYRTWQEARTAAAAQHTETTP